MTSRYDGGQGVTGADELERLLSPVVRGLPVPTSLSPLPFDLNAGVPDVSTLPTHELAEAVARALRHDPVGALTYGGSLGYEPLRAWLAEQQARESGVSLTAAHVALTSGSAHAIDNIAATFLGPGDVVVTPAPTYPGAIRAFRARGARIAPVPQDDDGIDISVLAEALERLRDRGSAAKLIYLVANYDNPSGSTLPPTRREAIVRLAREYRALIVEDDAYAGIDLDGPPPPPLFAAAEGHGILRVGTFSKTIATGLRVGWITADPLLIEPLAFMRFDNGSSSLVQRTVHEYLDFGNYESHVETLRMLYRARRDASAYALKELCEDYLSFRIPGGGFFHWLRLAEGLTSDAVVEAAARQGVAVTAGTGYYPQSRVAEDGLVTPLTERGERHIRLVYSALPPEQLDEAIQRFTVALAEVAGR